ncbi:glycosyltransferase, partial [Morganella morganii]|nr:glycosyltransferase [Morganella morganii]
MVLSFNSPSVPVLVSIIMPSFNSGRYIYKSINSVLNQTYTNFELIIVDDCSSDNTRDIVNSFIDDRIIFVRSESNSGSPATPRNIGLSKARGEVIAFLDSDDIWHVEKLEKQLRFMCDHNASFTCTSYTIIDESDNLVGKFNVPNEQVYEGLIFNNTVGCLTAMIDASIVKGFSFPKIGHEDFAFWLEISRINDLKIYGLDEQLASYRRRSGSVSSNKFKLFKFFWNIYRNQE